jgi:hypothetical protein
MQIANSLNGFVPQIWEKLENEDKKNLLPKYLQTWEKDSPERTEVIRALLKCLSTTERNFVHGAVKPRGPYRLVKIGVDGQLSL